MDIYVQSRGFAQDQDYCWLKVDGKGVIKPQLPPLGLEIANLIDNETPSVVLERLADKRLLLLLTGIEPDGRVDILNRPIRIAVAWVVSDSSEPMLRRLAIHALMAQEEIHQSEQNFLLAEIPKAVPLGGEYGFTILPEFLLKLVSGLESQELPASQPHNPNKKIGFNSSKLRNQLAEELQECQLPTEQGPLVIVTGIKKKETLEKAGVWRSLSSLADGEDWREFWTQPSFSLATITQGANYKNPLVWLKILIAIISYWLELILKFIGSSPNAVPLNRRESGVNSQASGNQVSQKVKSKSK